MESGINENMNNILEYEEGHKPSSNNTDHIVVEMENRTRFETTSRSKATGGHPPLPDVPDSFESPSIPLGTLMKYGVYKISQELTILSDLVPKSTDQNKKISIVEFSYLARQITVKILALVKWVKQFKKYRVCIPITYFLEQQAQLFIETADTLVRIAREELLYARVAYYEIPAAIDIQHGVFTRMPLCIKKRFIPEPPVTPQQEAECLSRLSYIIQAKIAFSSNKLSPRIKNIDIKNGHVTLTVPGEFAVCLTLLGEEKDTKWTLLNISILVEQYEIGYGTKLVHPLQLHTMHNLIQNRIHHSEEPIVELYTILHYFCVGLQLDVLFCEATQLITNQLKGCINIENYDNTLGSLTISYWPVFDGKRFTSSQFKFTVYRDDNSNNSGLRVKHFPLGDNLPGLDENNGKLSLSNLISETVKVRAFEKSLRIKKKLDSMKPYIIVEVVGVMSPKLIYPLLIMGTRGEEECLHISISMFSGNVVCNVPYLGDYQMLDKLSAAFNKNASVANLSKMIEKIRTSLLLKRYSSAIADLNIRLLKKGEVKQNIINNVLFKDKECLFFNLPKEKAFSIGIVFTPDSRTGVNIHFFLISFNSNKSTFMQLEPSKLIYSGTEINLVDSEDMVISNYENIRRAHEQVWIGCERQLKAAVAVIEEKISFIKICEQLDMKKIKYTQIARQSFVGGLYIEIKEFNKYHATQSSTFYENLRHCYLRVDSRAKVVWPLEFTVINTPVVSDYFTKPPFGDEAVATTGAKTCFQDIYESSIASQSYLSTSEAITSAVIERLDTFSKLYNPIERFAQAYYKYYHNHCNIVLYSYHKLIIAYGEKRDMLLFLTYKSKNKMFLLSFGQCLPRDTLNQVGPKRTNSKDDYTIWNPHSIVKEFLNEKLTTGHSLTPIIQYVVNTIRPLKSLIKFAYPKIRSIGAFSQTMKIDSTYPAELRCFLATQDDNIIRLSYGIIQLEFCFVSNGDVFIRDCSRSAPLSVGLGAFLDLMCPGASVVNLNTADNEYFSPRSLPVNSSNTSSPAKSNARLSLSVPAPKNNSADGMDISQNESADFFSMTIESRQLHYSTNRNVFKINQDSMEKMCLDTNVNSNFSYLDDYLYGINYLEKIGAILDFQKRDITLGGSNPSFVINNLSISMYHINATLFGIRHPNKENGWNINIHVYLDPKLFKVKCKLEFNGNSIPLVDDIETAEKYFEKCVVRSGNESSILSFINMCRICNSRAFANLAYLMKLEMNPNPDHFYKFFFQLAPTKIEQLPNSSMAIRPWKINPTDSSIDNSKIDINCIYAFTPNVLTLRPTGQTHDPREQVILDIFKRESEAAKAAGECCIARCINSILIAEKKSTL
uniref:Mediator of RNA polymerase II transcription subunit 14 n=1 Tax=Rhabditophanes sp. KR3021 TaxID=114890 RepID=A0AC35UAX2_9BILA